MHLSEVFSYVAFLQKNYGLTPDQLDKLARLPEVFFLIYFVLIILINFLRNIYWIV